jgi:hypothetical protein
MVEARQIERLVPPVHPERIEYPTNTGLARMRFLSKLLDNAILLPGGFRIGLDPLIGLIPAVGDVITSALSLWIVWEGTLLGLPMHVIARMLLNVFVDAMAGSLPVLGDLFDAAWKANAMNMRLAEKYYSPAAKPRSAVKIFFLFAFIFLFMASITVTLAYWLMKTFLSLFFS